MIRLINGELVSDNPSIDNKRCVIYDIVNLRTNQIYIGQTSESLMERTYAHFMEGISWKSDYYKLPWYNVVRDNDDLNNLVAEVLVYDPPIDKTERVDLEDKLISEYRELFGDELIYNDKNYKTMIHCQDPEAKQKEFSTKIEKYGSVNGAMMTPEAREVAESNRIATNLAKYGRVTGPLDPKITSLKNAELRRQRYGNANACMMTPEVRKKAKISNSAKYIYKGKLVIGLNQLYSLVSDSVSITYPDLMWKVKQPDNELGVTLIGRGRLIPVDRSRLSPDKLYYDLSEEEITYYLSLINKE